MSSMDRNLRYNPNSKEIELFDSIQYISSRIKAAGGTNMLEVDEEYISIICKQLSREQLRRWVDYEDQSWNSFFGFLENEAKKARKMQVLDNTRLGSVSHVQKKCDHCAGDHPS